MSTTFYISHIFNSGEKHTILQITLTLCVTNKIKFCGKQKATYQTPKSTR